MMNALYLHVVDDIKSKINDEVFGNGDKLPSERELSKQYDVSRNVIREAITVLQSEGLVVVHPGRGSYVTEPTLNIVTETIDRVMGNYKTSLEDIIDGREGIEVYVIKHVIQRATEDDVKTLYEIYDEMENHRHNVEQFVKFDEKLHIYLAKYTKNPLYEILLHSFLEMTQRILFDFTRLHPESVVEAQEHHLKIIKLIEQRDESAALELIKAHMKVLRDEIKILKDRKIIK